MKKILRKILSKSDSAYKFINSYCFGTADCMVLFYFDAYQTPKKDLAKSIDNQFELMNIDVETIDPNTIQKIVIACSEIVTNREEGAANSQQQSICFNLFNCLKKIFQFLKQDEGNFYSNLFLGKNIHEQKGYALFEIDDIFQRYELTVNSGYDDLDGSNSVYCKSSIFYNFEIEFSKKIIKNEDILEKILIDHCLKMGKIEVPHYYCSLLTTKPSMGDNKEVSIVGTNTKIRRIGYFKLLSEFFKRYTNIPKSVIYKKFESYSTPFEEELNKYDNSKGVIRETKTGISAKPYIDFAKSIGLLTYLNGLYSAGKTFRVYIQLKDALSTEEVFRLSFFDKFYFGEIILRKDFLYITNILELLYIFQETDYSRIKACFQPYTLKRLAEIKKHRTGYYQLSKKEVTKTIERHKRLKRNVPDPVDIIEHELTAIDIDNTEKIYQRILSWKKPDIYLEHILMPRLNWLFDLGWIYLDKKLNISLTPAGSRLFQHICCWSDMVFGRVVSPDFFLDNHV